MPVYRQPRIVLLTTGDEVVELGIPLPEGKIYNSNMTMLSARLRELGIESFHMEAVKDDPTVMSEKLKEAAKAADMIITTGGVSVGKKDIMHESLRLMGAERIFWRVKMKPGMPTLFSAYKKNFRYNCNRSLRFRKRDSDHQSLRKSFWCCSQHRTFDSSCIGKNDAGSINRSERSKWHYG